MIKIGIEVNKLGFSYGRRTVLHDLSFSVKDSEFLSILGPNGVGKSTLFRCMSGISSAYTGSVRINGREARTLKPKELASMLAYIPQSCSPAFNFSVEDVVLMGVSGRLGSFSMPGRKDLDHVHWALDKLGIDHLSDRCFHHLSGGERQLVIIARALVQNAGILMLDEPTASLDYGNQIKVLTQAKRLAGEGYTVIQSTHDPETAYLFSDRVLALKKGTVLTNDRPQTSITEENMSKLYGIDICVSSLYNDRVRICTAKSALE